jgi:CRP-like cAMP-binding protein
VASDRRELLRRVPLFAELDRRELDEVASSLRERKFSQGENVLTEGRASPFAARTEHGWAPATISARSP